MKHFTLSELSRSATAQLHNIHNEPPQLAKRRLENLVDKCLDPLREAWGAPLLVTSGYRNALVNRVVGGVSTSQHISGEAADIVPKNIEDIGKLFRLAHKILDYDQLLLEYNKKDGKVRCLHVSCKLDSTKNRHYANAKYLL